MRILITDDVHPLLVEQLRSNSHQVDYLPAISLADVHECIYNYHGLIINSKIIVDQNLLSKAQNLQWIGRLGSGMEIIDIEEATRRGIHLVNTPEANCNAVAEHALAMILCLFRNINKADLEVKSKIWQREANRGIELSGRTIGIVGYGHTGSSFASILTGFNAKIIIFDKYKQLSDLTSRYQIAHSVRELQEESEIISLHLPLSPETRYMVDELFIANCKLPFYLINTSRGSVVKTDALLSGLQSGKILGACLDVYENEKPASYNQSETILYDKLLSQPNLICTPHIAGWTNESKYRIAEIMLSKLFKYI